MMHDKDLNIFQAFYTLLIALGLTDLWSEIFRAYFEVGASEKPGNLGWAMFFGLAIVPITIRMFWSVEALCRYLSAENAAGRQRAEKDGVVEESRIREYLVSPRRIVFWYYTALFLNSLLVYMLCESAILLTTNGPFWASIRIISCTFFSLLLFNTIYIATVVPSEEAASQFIQVEGKNLYLDGGREFKGVWAYNNGTVAVIALIVAVSVSVGRIPTFWPAAVLLVAMFANSWVDFYKTAPYYVNR